MEPRFLFCLRIIDGTLCGFIFHFICDVLDQILEKSFYIRIRGFLCSDGDFSNVVVQIGNWLTLNTSTHPVT